MTEREIIEELLASIDEIYSQKPKTYRLSKAYWAVKNALRAAEPAPGHTDLMISPEAIAGGNAMTTTPAPTTLGDRCKSIYQQMQRDAMLRQGNPVETLLAFVIAEQGRGAAPEFTNSLPLCLYFGSEKDRAEFVELIREAKPGMITRELP